MRRTLLRLTVAAFMGVAMAVSAPAAFAAPPNVVEHCLKYEAHGAELLDKTLDRDPDKAIEFYEKGLDKLGACLDKF